MDKPSIDEQIEAVEAEAKHHNAAGTLPSRQMQVERQQALRAAADTLRGARWNYDMDAAPKDGTPVVATFEGSTVCGWMYEDCLHAEGIGWERDALTAWRALPEPATPPAQEASHDR